MCTEQALFYLWQQISASLQTSGTKPGQTNNAVCHPGTVLRGRGQLSPHHLLWLLHPSQGWRKFITKLCVHHTYGSFQSYSFYLCQAGIHFLLPPCFFSSSVKLGFMIHSTWPGSFAQVLWRMKCYSASTERGKKSCPPGILRLHSSEVGAALPFLAPVGQNRIWEAGEDHHCLVRAHQPCFPICFHL